MQKKQVALAVVGAFAGLAATSAFAGVGGISASGTQTYATESVANIPAAGVANPNVSYSMTNPIATGTRPIFRITLDAGAKFATCPALKINKDTSPAVVVVPVDAVATGTLPQATCIYQPAAGLAASVPSNANLDFDNTGKLVSLGALATSGAVVNATVAVFDAGGISANDGNTVIVARSADSMSVSAQSSAVFSPTAETSKINITTAGGKALTNPTDVTAGTLLADIGSVTVTMLSGIQTDASSTAPDEVVYAKLTGAALQALTLDVTGTFQIGSKVSLNDKADCTGATVGAAVTVAAATASKVTFTAADITAVAETPAALSGIKKVYVCYAPVGTATIPTSQFSVSGKFVTQTATGTAALDAKVLAATPLYNLVLDAAQVDLRQFWSAATSTANGGWVQIIRIINTSTTAADIQGQYIAETTGALVGSPATMVTALPAGAVAALLGTDVETKIGAAPAGIHRLRITAPVSSLRVQSFLRDPKGSHLAIADQGVENNLDAATGAK